MADERADFLARYFGSVNELAGRGDAGRWNLPAGLLSDAIYASVRAWARNDFSTIDEAAIQAYLLSIKAQDLILACACRAGIAEAWDEFIERYRPKLYQAARVLTHDEVKARELADSLYADLYGLEYQNGVRRSLLAYFHGRSSLLTWLRAVLAQRFIDSQRSEQRTHSQNESLLADAVSDIIEPPDPNRANYVNALSQALTFALEGLRPRDRMRLNFYYVESLTLKQIGHLMKEYESTVSRRLARTRKYLRENVERGLRRSMRYSNEQIRLCYDYAAEDGLNALSQMLKSADGDALMRKNIAPTRSTS